MRFSYILLLFSFFTFLSCTSSQKALDTSKDSNTAVQETKDDTQEREKLLNDNGFVKATVKKRECGWILETIDSNKSYFANEWIEEAYKEEGKIVFVKFSISEQPNTNCPNTQSIVMEEIKLIR